MLVYNNAEDAAQHVINDHSQIKYEYSVEDLSSDGEEEDFNISVHKLKPSSTFGIVRKLIFSSLTIVNRFIFH